MNNKKLGTEFERKVCRILSNDNWWVHFISPDNRGAQPFDIIAVKNGLALAADCKTSASRWFSINRLEDNQIMAFEKWIACGNLEPKIIVGYKGQIILVGYKDLKEKGKVDLEELDGFFVH